MISILVFLVSAIPAPTGPPGFELLLAINLLTLAVLAYRQHMHNITTRQQSFEIFSRRLIESQEAERKRIATELHDSLGQNLLVIKNRALMALQHCPNTLDHLSEICYTASQAIDEVRNIAYALRPHGLDRQGLTRSLESLLTRISNSSDIHFSLRLDNIDGLFSRESETSIYRILQESVNNIVRHSGADQACIEIVRDEASVSITVADDGVGFQVDSVAGGLGLAGIAERVRFLEGTSRIVSAPGAGTTISIRIGCKGAGHER
jgi:signal transduction histidine kinase